MDNEQDIRRIHIGSDHAGFEYKKELIKFLEMKDYEVIDHGAFELDDKDDYPDFVLPVAVEATQDEHSVGIILGGSGQGEAMVANRVPGIRATVFYGNPNPDENMVVLSKQHNYSNVLSLGARFISLDEAKDAVETWLETAFSGDERHIRRISKIDNLDSLMTNPDE